MNTHPSSFATEINRVTAGVKVTGSTREEPPLMTCRVTLEDCKDKLGPNGVYFLREETGQRRRSERVMHARLTGVRKQSYQEDDSGNYDDDDDDDDGDGNLEDPAYSPQSDEDHDDEDDDDNVSDEQGASPQEHSHGKDNVESNPGYSPLSDEDDVEDGDISDEQGASPQDGEDSIESQAPQPGLVNPDHLVSSEDMESSSKEVYICNLCGDRFTKKYYVKLHRLLHDKRATLSQCLAEPVRDVTVLKLAQCSLCGKMQTWDQVDIPSSCHGGRKNVPEQEQGAFVCGTCQNGTQQSHEEDGETAESPESPASSHALADYVPPRQDVENPWGEVYVCLLCGDRFTKKYYMKLHRLIHDETATLASCLSEPMKYAKTIWPFQCDICDRKLSSFASLRSHQRQHVEEIPEHQLNDKGQKVYKCDECGTLCVGMAYYCDHLGKHRGLKSHVCSWCGNAFAYVTGLRCHQKWSCKKMPRDKMAAKQRLYTCTQCPKRFTHRSILWKHMVTHSEDRPFKCSLCTKAFKTATTLRTHRRTHSVSERPFLCDVCGKAYGTLHRLKTHAMTHTGERPYQCTLCPRRFLHSYDLKNHSVRHAGTFTYICSTCDKGFCSRYALEKHERVHTKEKPYYCAICKKKFGYSESLQQHNRKFHSG